MALPGNLIHSDHVREAIFHCVRYLTTETSDKPLEINRLMDLRKQGVFASSHFVVDVDNYLEETIHAAKALVVTLARWINDRREPHMTVCRGRVQVCVMQPHLADMNALKDMGFGQGSASWAYTWLTPV